MLPFDILTVVLLGGLMRSRWTGSCDRLKQKRSCNDFSACPNEALGSARDTWPFEAAAAEFDFTAATEAIGRYYHIYIT